MTWLRRYHLDRGSGENQPPPRKSALWFGVLAGPTAWGLAFMLNVFIIRGACLAPWAATRYWIIILAGLVALAGLLTAHASYRRLRSHEESQMTYQPGDDRFLASSGLLLSGISLLLALGLLIALLALDPCSFGRGDVRL